MGGQMEGGWQLEFDDVAFPHYLLIKVSGLLDKTFYTQLLADLEAHMGGAASLYVPYVPIIFDGRDCLPSPHELGMLKWLARRPECRANRVILCIRQCGVLGSVQYSAALMLRIVFRNVQIVNRLDEAYSLLDIPSHMQQTVELPLKARAVRWALTQ